VGTIPARQQRSRDTEARILAAAERVFARSGVTRATVAEICRAAGVAVGTFYGHFRDKDGLLAAYFADHYARSTEALEASFTTAAWRGRPAAEIVDAWVRSRVERYLDRRDVIRAILTYTRAHSAASFRTAVAEYSAHVVERFTALLDGSADGIAHPSPRRAAVVVVSMIEALLKELTLYGEVRSRALAIADDELVPELTRMARGYLGIPYGVAHPATST